MKTSTKIGYGTSLNILLQFEGPLLGVDDEGLEGDGGTGTEDEEPESTNSVFSLSA